MTYEDAVKEIKLNKEETLKRFCGNEALMRRFLLKFPNDTSIEQFRTAWQDKDYDLMQQTSHTLKGVCGNLGLQALYDSSFKINSALKKGDKAFVDANADEFLALCDKTISTIKSIE